MNANIILTTPGPVENHRKREKGLIVYPVYSRRSGGLSLGINLFPDKKHCSFNCPYCEVFPFSNDAEFSLEQMEAELESFIRTERNVPVRDICFSGNGEPTLSPDFPEALELAARFRADIAQDAALVLISNGAFLLDDRLFPLLRDGVNSFGLDIWLKLDAGTPGWYEKMNRSKLPFEELTEKAKKFASLAPLTIQTMLCAIDGEGPPLQEEQSWEKLLVELAVIARAEGGKCGGNAGVRKVQVYGKVRPAPEDPKASALPVECLEKRAGSLRSALAASYLSGLVSAVPPVEVYP